MPVSRTQLSLAVFGLVSVIGLFALLPPARTPSSPQAAAILTASNPFIYSFNTSGVLYEAGSPDESWSSYWWLNSGGKLIIKDYVGQTIQGDLSVFDIWRLRYAFANSLDTDGGAHPQNIFRLVTRSEAGDQRLQALFKIERDNWSNSPNRNASNGLLLMSKYIDGDTLYYAGLRVDGTAVIKKKYNGIYYTLAQEEVFSGEYSRDKNVNLIPRRQWIGLRSESVTDTNGNVIIRLFMKPYGETQWTQILEAVDDGTYGNTPPITAIGHGGIRTDFMDVTFESFRMEAI